MDCRSRPLWPTKFITSKMSPKKNSGKYRPRCCAGTPRLNSTIWPNPPDIVHARRVRCRTDVAQAPSLDAFHRDAARQVRALTGFDRIMIYRFAESGDGEVITEVASPNMESYLGLHYPASDIPAQARMLYLRNSFRIIADVSSETVPLVSYGAKTAEPIDLSLAVTRAVSPVHIEYLRNMGVGASVSVSV